MNKPLTIEQLKALQVGDWVWIKFEEDNPIDKRYASQERYFQIIEPENDTAIRFNNYVPMQYADYGTKWTAYKNKEEAEGVDDIEREAQIAMAKNIFQEMYDIVNESHDEVITVTADDVKRIAKRYGVEVRK